MESVFINERVRDGSGVPTLDPGGGSGTLYTDLLTDTLYVWDGSSWAAVSGGGGGTISGTIANTQVAFSTAADTIGGSALLTYTTATQILAVPRLNIVHLLTTDPSDFFAFAVDATFSDPAGLPGGVAPGALSLEILPGAGNIGNYAAPFGTTFYHESTSTITKVVGNDVYLENVDVGTISTLIGLGVTVYNTSTGTLGDVAAFRTEGSSVGPGNQSTGTITSYTSYDAVALTASGTYGQVYGLKLANQSALTVSGNNHAINYASKFIVDSTGAIFSGLAGTVTGSLKLRGTTSGTVTVSTADAAGTWTMKLPTTDGDSGQFLQTDGSGVTTWATVSTGITIGTTTITSGTSTRVLYNNAGVVGEYTLTGTGTVVVMQTAPTLTGPVTIAEAVGSSGLTLTGATQTSSFPVLSATQTWNASGTTFAAIFLNVTNTASAAASKLMDLQVGAASKFSVDKNGAISVSAGNCTIDSSGVVVAGDLRSSGDCRVASGGTFYWNNDTFINRPAAATIQFGQNVNGSAVSQQLQVANGITGTDRTGGNFTVASGKGTGAGAVSALIFQTPTVLASGTTAQSLATRLTINSSGLTIADAMNVILNATTGTQIATATTQKLGFYGATPIVQGASVADASGGAVIDAEARTAINALISRIEATGLIATV